MKRFKLISTLQDPELEAVARNTALAVYKTINHNRTTAITVANGLVAVVFRPAREEIIIVPMPLTAGFYEGPYYASQLVATITADGSKARLITRAREVDTSNMHPVEGQIGSKPLYDIAVGAKYQLGIPTATVNVYAKGSGILQVKADRCFYAAGVEKNTLHLCAAVKSAVKITHKSVGDCSVGARLIFVVDRTSVRGQESGIATSVRVYLDADTFQEPLDVTSSVVVSDEAEYELPLAEYSGVFTGGGGIVVPFDVLQLSGPRTFTVGLVAKIADSARTAVTGRVSSFFGPRLTNMGFNPGNSSEQDVIQYYEYNYTDYKYSESALCYGLFKEQPAVTLTVVSVGADRIVLSAEELVPVFGEEARNINVNVALDSRDGWAYYAIGDSAQKGLLVLEGIVLASGVDVVPPITAEIIDLGEASAGLFYKASIFDEPIPVSGTLVSIDATTLPLVTSLHTGTVDYIIASSSSNVEGDNSNNSGPNATINTEQSRGYSSGTVFPISYSNRVYGLINHVVTGQALNTSAGNRSNGFDRFMNYYNNSARSSETHQKIKQVSISPTGEFNITDFVMGEVKSDSTYTAVRTYNGEDVVTGDRSPTIEDTTGVGAPVTLNYTGEDLYSYVRKTLGSSTIKGTVDGYDVTVSGPFPVGLMRPVALDVGLGVAGPPYELIVVGAKEVQIDADPVKVLSGEVVDEIEYGSELFSESSVIRGGISVITSTQNITSQTPIVYPFTAGNAVISVSYESSFDYSAVGVASYFGSGIRNPEGDYTTERRTTTEYLVAPEVVEGCIPKLDGSALNDGGTIVVVAVYDGKVVYDIYKCASRQSSAKAVYGGFDLAEIYNEFLPADEEIARQTINDRLNKVSELAGEAIVPLPPVAVALGARAKKLSLTLLEKDLTAPGTPYRISKDELVTELKSISIASVEVFDALYTRDDSSTHNMKEIAMRAEVNGVVYVLPSKF